MSSLISIIIPVYNAEKYLRRCLNSILSQKNSSFEVLLVNDGSIDNSGKICDEYEKKDPRIHTYHKDNGGVSSARNLGLDYAQGIWISFVDADDFLDEDFLTGIDDYSCCDVLQKSHLTIDENDNVFAKKIVTNRILSRRPQIQDFFINNRTNALWDKLIKRTAIGNNRFDENIAVGEDFIFFLNILPAINVYGFSVLGNYFYVVRKNSTMSTIDQKTKERLNIIEVNIKHIEDILDKQKNDILKKGIIYGSYVPILLERWAELYPTQKELVRKYIYEFNWKTIRLLNWRKKKKLIKSLLKYYLRRSF